jgi:outer membrane protein OmpA-like peptidoglycan-associated protein
MSLNLIDSVRSRLEPGIVSTASAALNEDGSRVHNAMSGIVPAVLAGILNKAGSGDAGGILNMAKDTANSGILSNMAGFSGNNSLLTRGADLLKGIFGNRLIDVTNEISNFFGISSASTASLMSIAAPAALGTLGEHAQATNMNATGLLSFLNSEKVSILSALPPELNMAGAMGLSSINKIESKLSRALYNETAHVRDVQANREKTKTSRWLVPALAAIVFIGIIWFLNGRTNNKPEDGQEVTSAREPGAIASSPRAVTIVRLPDGTQLNAYKGGIEDQLVMFLNDASRPVDNKTWFDFDNLNFETGSSTITPASMPQIRHIAMILKAFPNANIKIGGYTDKTGNESANMQLSQARADAVVAELKNNGITDAQLSGAEGYGSQFAKAPADASDEERKKDRRIAVSVRKK